MAEPADGPVGLVVCSHREAKNRVSEVATGAPRCGWCHSIDLDQGELVVLTTRDEPDGQAVV